jgi:hypothetical protein
LRPYPLLAADALPEIGKAVISAVLSLDQHLSQHAFPVSPNFVTNRCNVILFGTYLSHYAFAKISRTANDFDAKNVRE